MNDISALIFQQTGVKASYFSPVSRYYSLEITQYESTRQGPLAYVRRRFLPSPEKFHVLHEHIVSQGDRPDTLTHQYLNDPEQFWRICDANGVMRPEELTEVIGRHVRITLPGEISI